MKKVLAGLLALLLLAVPLSSCLADITAEGYAAAEKHFTSVFEKTEVIGAGILVNQGGERIFECYYGYGNWAHDRAVDADTVYKVASVSKHIAAIGLMRLYDQGLIDLDAPLTSESGKAIANPYYPDRTINLRQVMSHTSSFKDDAPYFGYIQWDLNDLQNNRIFTAAAPGSRFVYSNLNGGIINSVIELVTGQNFNQYMTENVFQPLGINASYAAHLLPDTSTISNTYYADGTHPIREYPGRILVRDCTVKNADRFLHYNYNNERWQSGAPMRDITFERVTAEGIKMPLTAYGQDSNYGYDFCVPLDLTLRDCSISFGEEVPEFIRGANVRSLVLENVKARGVKGPLLRTWQGETEVKAKGLEGIGADVEKGTGSWNVGAI